LIAENAEFDRSSVGAWKRIVDRALSDQVDAVVIAGDVFDGRGGYIESRQAFAEGVQSLGSKGIPVVAVAGNHDYDVLPLFAQSTYPNFYLVGKRGKWEVIHVETPSGPLAFVGWSFTTEYVRQSQAELLTRGYESVPVIGVVHGDLAPQSDYHPIDLANLTGKADAWVLGHIHKPWDVSPSVVYPGSPQALDFGPGERGAHGVRILEISDGAVSFAPAVGMSTVRYEQTVIVAKPQPGQHAIEAALEEGRQVCLEISSRTSTESVQLRADVVFEGIDELPKMDDLREHTFSDAHSVLFSSFRIKRTLDPWELKDLHSQSGEVARLLIGARQLTSPTQGSLVQAGWVESAKRIIEHSALDIERHYRLTLGSVQDWGEAAQTPPTSEEYREMACKLLIEELEEMLVREEE
jgi:DNA repair exonuclease SbcCD nuclease subunit